jgi:hypothetical protein
MVMRTIGWPLVEGAGATAGSARQEGSHAADNATRTANWPIADARTEDI